MASVRKGTEPVGRRRPPARTPEAREKQLIADAYDRAEQQIRDGTASSQVITHFLRLGSTRELLEQERLRHENELLTAKAEAMAEQKKMGEMYEKALIAMSLYQGHQVPDEYIEE